MGGVEGSRRNLEVKQKFVDLLNVPCTESYYG